MTQGSILPDSIKCTWKAAVWWIQTLYINIPVRGYCIIPVAIKILSLISYTRSYLNFFFWSVHSWQEAKVTARFADYVGIQNSLSNMLCKLVVDKLQPTSLWHVGASVLWQSHIFGHLRWTEPCSWWCIGLFIVSDSYGHYMPLLQLAMTWGLCILVQWLWFVFFLTIFEDGESSFLWLAGMLYI